MSWPTTPRRERGYGPEWDRLRKEILERDQHLCRCRTCREAGLVKVATEVDHIVPKAKGGTDEPSNLQAINRECHKRKTIEENGGQFIARQPVDVTGIPKGWK